jgi:DNA-binding MarR family transcriptional regulator
MLPDIQPSGEAGIEAERLAEADQLGHELVRLNRLMARVGAHVAAHSRDVVDPAAYVLLVQLVTDGPQRLSQLAEAVRSDPSTVSRQVAALVRAGLIERKADPADGRANWLVATELGERVLRVNRQRRNAHLATMLRDWDPAAVTTLSALLERFNTDLDGYRSRLMDPQTLKETAR